MDFEISTGIVSQYIDQHPKLKLKDKLYIGSYIVFWLSISDDLGYTNIKPEYHQNHSVEKSSTDRDHDNNPPNIVRKGKYFFIPNELFARPDHRNYALFLIIYLHTFVPFLDIDNFLDYQFKKCTDANFDFFRFLQLGEHFLDVYGRCIINSKIKKISEEWIERKKTGITEFVTNPNKINNNKRIFINLTDGQATLIIYYMYNHYLEIGVDINKTELARFIYLLLGKPSPKTIKDTEIYHKICKAPNFNTDKFLIKDLITVHEIFEEYGLSKIAIKVQEEIELCKKETKQNKENNRKI